MGLQKPTISVCIDGKDHGWMIAAEEIDSEGRKWEHRWCLKCGALTQVTYNDQGEAIAVLDQEKNVYMMVPKVLAAVIR